jgi:CRP/FNR family transcriptional regulator, cyclic AMP receptor protein
MAAKDWPDALAGCPLFEALNRRHLRKLAALAKIVEFSPGEIVAQYGEPGDAFYLVMYGRARVLGQKRARSSLGPGGFFGEVALLDGGPRSATVTAGTQLVALMIPRRPFLKLLEQEPKIALSMLKELAARLRKVEKSAA